MTAFNPNRVASLIAGIALVLTFVQPASVRAQTAPQLCIPKATGVPYWGGAPDWWSSYPDASQRRLATQFDVSERSVSDPRWRGALAIGYGLGATTPAEFKLLQTPSGDKLLLSWTVKSIQAFNLNQTGVWFGYSWGTSGTSSKYYRIKLLEASTAAAGNVIEARAMVSSGTSYLAVDEYTPTGSGAFMSDPVDPFTATAITSSDMRVWIDGGSPKGWAIQLALTIPANTSALRLWSSVQVSGHATPSGSAGLPGYTYTWPRSDLASGLKFIGHQAQNSQGFYEWRLPAVSDWGTFHLNANANCAGIAIDDGDIGVFGPAGSDPTRSTFSLSDANTVYAMPKNRGSSTQDMTCVGVTFYEAAWGTQRGDLTGNSWRRLGLPYSTTGPATCLPGGTNVLLASPQAVSTQMAGLGATNAYEPVNGTWVARQVQPGEKVDVSVPWTLSQPQRCSYSREGFPNQYLVNYLQLSPLCTGPQIPPPPLDNPHSCIMAKLSGPHQFIRDSALRNMNFGNASVFERDAEINVGGGKSPVRGGQHTVLLIEDRRNLPSYSARLKSGRLLVDAVRVSAAEREMAALIRDPRKVTDLRSDTALRYLASQPRLRDALVERQPRLRDAVAKYQARLRERGHPELPLYDELARTLPTYVMHAFADTGEEFFIDGIRHRLMEQQTSFGVFPLHGRDHYGWLDRTSSSAVAAGHGVHAVQVPEGKRTQVRFRIEAVERPRALKDHKDIELPAVFRLERPVPDPEPQFR